MTLYVYCTLAGCDLEGYLHSQDVAELLKSEHEKQPHHLVDIRPIGDSLTSNPTGGNRAPEGGAR